VYGIAKRILLLAINHGIKYSQKPKDPGNENIP
jgi:hypothetical protein